VDPAISPLFFFGAAEDGMVEHKEEQKKKLSPIHWLGIVLLPLLILFYLFFEYLPGGGCGGGL
jgi:hypothetical protein